MDDDDYPAGLPVRLLGRDGTVKFTGVTAAGMSDMGDVRVTVDLPPGQGHPGPVGWPAHLVEYTRET